MIARLNAKTASILGIVWILMILMCGWGFAIGRFEVFPFQALKEAYDFVYLSEDAVEEELPTLFDKITRHRLEIDNKFPDVNGFVTREEGYKDPGYLILSRFSLDDNQTIVELVRLSDFKVLHRWVPPILEILKQSPLVQGEYYLHAFYHSKEGFSSYDPLLLSDGRIVIHSGWGPLVCLDKDSKIEWIWDGRGVVHHSIELNEDGMLVVTGNTLLPRESTLPPDVNITHARTFPRDGYYVIDPANGKVLRQENIADILIANNYEGLMFGIPTDSDDPLHLNDAQPVLTDAGIAKRGDIAFSLRNISTVFLYRPSTKKIVWLRTGPWIYQHDVDVLPDGRLSIFNNNSLATNYRKYRDYSEVYVCDPQTDEITSPYREVLKESESFTLMMGLCRILPDGDLYFEQSEEARIFRTSPEHIRWEFVNATRDGLAGRLHLSRYFLPEEIDLGWLSRDEFVD
ncbi:hypothetical protein GC197_02375 [bacterium]|nr:hypothetical protein [bacterium]